jgi:hypothetical protein
MRQLPTTDFVSQIILNYEEGYGEKRENNYKPIVKYDRWKTRNGFEVH